MNKKQKQLSIASGIVAVIVLLVAVVIIKGWYPAAIVGFGMISADYWKQGQEIAQKLDPSLASSTISDQLIKIKEEQLLAQQVDVAAELKFDTTGKDLEYKDLLVKYFNSDIGLFVEFVVKPQAYDAALRIKYNSDFQANVDAYKRAQDILAQIKNGKSFDDLAKTLSDDKITGQLGGDLGFAASGQILPELEKIMVNAKVGEVYPEIVVSRLGYNILYPVETAEKDGPPRVDSSGTSDTRVEAGQKIWHVKNILVKTTGFEEWLNMQLKSIWVWRIK